MSEALAPALRDRAELFALLSTWSERGWLRELDRALVQLFAELDPQASPLLLLGAALASHQLGQGHVCLDLAATLANPDFTLSLPPEGEDAQEAMILPGSLCGQFAAGVRGGAVGAQRRLSIYEALLEL